ncbi:MAG TPA: flagellar motor stator protein MotA [Candidatus Ozemobacteraceae bacterium]|nr:flagellar motor stator protein MotA [Candidatus Ozemobacteraceae bacterium]
MPLIVGLLIVIGSMLTGYLLHGGTIGPLLQISEFIIIGGAAFGSVVIGNGFGGVQSVLSGIRMLLKPRIFDQPKYLEQLELMYAIFDLARREGVLVLEQHTDNPANSELFKRFPRIAENHHTISFICDSLRMIVTGGVNDVEIARLMEEDLDVMEEEAMIPSGILSTVGDSMPGYGIVAAVLGVVITMQAIGGPPEQIGHKVAAALVGTFLGVLLAYGIVNPMAKSLENQVRDEDAYMRVIRCALEAFSRGYAAKNCIEIARRHIPPRYRPTFEDTEKLLAAKGTAATA